MLQWSTISSRVPGWVSLGFSVLLECAPVLPFQICQSSQLYYAPLTLGSLELLTSLRICLFICITKFLKALGLFLLDPVHLCSPIGIYGNMCGITIPWSLTVLPGLCKSKLMTSFHILCSLKTALLPSRLRPSGRGPSRSSYLVEHQPFNHPSSPHTASVFQSYFNQNCSLKEFLPLKGLVVKVAEAQNSLNPLGSGQPVPENRANVYLSF